LIYRLFSTAALAGLISGLVASAVQQIQVEPLIRSAEVYEARAATTQGKDTDSRGHHHNQRIDHQTKRLLNTAVANIVIGIGYGLLLCSAFTLYRRAIGFKLGLLWGLAGFTAFSFIPAIGLPPEIPGMVGTDLTTRQIWWLSSALANCIGLALIAFAAKPWWRLLGGLVIALPFFIGVPHPSAQAGFNTHFPPDLVANYTVAVLATGIVFWGTLGGAAGYLFDRSKRFSEE